MRLPVQKQVIIPVGILLVLMVIALAVNLYLAGVSGASSASEAG